MKRAPGAEPDALDQPNVCGIGMAFNQPYLENPEAKRKPRVLAVLL
jgi:hypothetical protein